jgi:hypothetical protein
VEDSFETSFGSLKLCEISGADQQLTASEGKCPVELNEIRKPLDFIKAVKNIINITIGLHLHNVCLGDQSQEGTGVFSHELKASHYDCMATGFVGASTLRATGESKHSPHVLALLMFPQQNSNCPPVMFTKAIVLTF